jgi:hypothetical protein
MKTDADILAEGREYIERNGWWRGSFRGPNGKQVCAMGAIVASQGWLNTLGHINTEQRDRAERIAAKVLAAATYTTDRFGRTHLRLWDWNDAELTTKQMVLDAFAKAEKIERAGFDPDE